jgi:two-component system, LuxR family, sensor kinase FixL
MGQIEHRQTPFSANPRPNESTVSNNQTPFPPAEPESAAERRYRLMVEFAPNAMIMVAPSGVIVMVNAEAEHIFGYSRTELLGRSIEMLVPERFRAAHPEMRVAFFASPSARAMGAGRDLYGLKKDGQEFPIEIGLNPIDTEDGLMVMASVIDISERKASEFALRESEHRARSLAAIVESSGDAIISLSLDGRVATWNKAAEHTFGYTAAEMMRQPIVRLAAPGYEPEMLEIVDRIRRGSHIDHYETRRRHKDGSILDVSLTESPIYDADGQLVGISKVLRDITARKAAEAALKQSEARLQELNTELLHVSRMSTMGQMAAVVTHELNQPLTAITSYMDTAALLLGRGGEVPISRLSGLLERAGQQASRAGNIIERLRGFMSRGDTDKRVEAVPPLLMETAELVLIGIKQKGISIGLQPDLPDAKILADKVQIQQVLLNLLRNAMEAVAQQGDPQVSLAAEARNGSVSIRVIDNGPGLPEEVQAKLFQPFVSTKRNGMGVGLSICHTIISAHDGSIRAEPNPDGGTIFRITLPLAPENQ